MKFFTTALATCLSTAAFASTQVTASSVVFYENYSGPQNYSKKVESTLETPLTSAWLTPTNNVHRAICFNGPANEAMDIIRKMIATDGELNKTKILSFQYDVDNTSVGNPFVIKNLEIQTLILGQKLKYHFAQIRPCNRVSKAQ